MKITHLSTRTVWASHERSWLFIEVHADNGLVGFGEASQSRNDAGVIEEIRRLAPLYVNENPLDIIARRRALLDWPYVGRTLFAAVSGLEQAIWDLCGKHLKVPVYQLLGGRARDRVRAYANIGYAAPQRSPESLARTALEAVSSGFDAVKFYPFGINPGSGATSQDERRWVDSGIANVRAVRSAVGDSVDILVDLMHQFRDAKQVLDILRQLDSCKLFWVEDPFVHDHLSELVALRRSIGPRLAGGAPILTRHEWRPLLEGGAFDVIMPDVKWLGGIDEARKVAAMADAFGALVSPHNASGPVANAASLHLSLTLPNFLILEYPWGVPSWRGDLTRGTERMVGGHFEVPTAPGLGIDLDLAIASAHSEPPAFADSGVQLPIH